MTAIDSLGRFSNIISRLPSNFFALVRYPSQAFEHCEFPAIFSKDALSASFTRGLSWSRYLKGTKK